MIKTSSEYICDCCLSKLYKKELVSNNGKFQEDFVQIDTSIICFSCLGKYMYVKSIKNKQSKKDLENIILETRKILDPIGNNKTNFNF